MNVVDPIKRDLEYFSRVDEVKQSTTEVQQVLPQGKVFKYFAPVATINQIVMANGQQFTVLEKSELMHNIDQDNYLKLETDAQMRAAASMRNPGLPVKPLASQKDVSNPSVEIDMNDEGPDVVKAMELREGVRITDIIDGYSHAQVHMKVMSHLKPAMENMTSVEYITNILDAVFYNDDPSLVKPYIDKMLAATSFNKFIEALDELKESELDGSVYYAVKDRIVAAFNRRLAAGINKPDWKITDLIEDYNEALNGVSELFVATAVDTFKDNTLDHIKQSLNVNYADNFLSFSERFAVVYLPWVSDELGFVLTQKYNQLTNDEFNHIAPVFLAVAKRNHPNVSRIVVYTRDNVAYELHMSDLARNLVTISKYPVA